MPRSATAMRTFVVVGLVAACGSARPPSTSAPVVDPPVQADAPPAEPPPQAGPPKPEPPVRSPAPARREPAPPIAVGARLPVRPVTATRGVLPIAIVDWVGSCVMTTTSHLEGLAIDTGATAWSTAAWSAVVGELPDGDLVVAADSGAGRIGVAVAVLGRQDGAVRFSCAAPDDAGAVTAAWRGAGDALTVELDPVQQVRGTPTMPSMAHASEPYQLTISSTACALSRLEPAVNLADLGPWVATPSTWKAGAITLALRSASASPGSLVTDDALEARRGGRVLWSRELPWPTGAPCKVQ